MGPLACFTRQPASSTIAVNRSEIRFIALSLIGSKQSLYATLILWHSSEEIKKIFRTVSPVDLKVIVIAVTVCANSSSNRDYVTGNQLPMRRRVIQSFAGDCAKHPLCLDPGFGFF